jgi:hypothetical protein
VLIFVLIVPRCRWWMGNASTVLTTEELKWKEEEEKEGFQMQRILDGEGMSVPRAWGCYEVVHHVPSTCDPNLPRSCVVQRCWGCETLPRQCGVLSPCPSSYYFRGSVQHIILLPVGFHDIPFHAVQQLFRFPGPWPQRWLCWLCVVHAQVVLAFPTKIPPRLKFHIPYIITNR